MYIKGMKIHWAWGLIGLLIIVLTVAFPAFMSVDNAQNISQGFIGAALGVIGGLAKGAVSLFSGAGKKARKAAKQAKKDAKAAQKEAEAAAKTAEYRAEEQAAKAKTAGSNIMNIITKYWWVGALVIGAIVVLPMLKKKVGRSNKGGARSRTGAAGKAWSRRMVAAKRRKRATRKK